MLKDATIVILGRKRKSNTLLYSIYFAKIKETIERLRDTQLTSDYFDYGALNVIDAQTANLDSLNKEMYLVSPEDLREDIFLSVESIKEISSESRTLQQVIDAANKNLKDLETRKFTTQIEGLRNQDTRKSDDQEKLLDIEIRSIDDEITTQQNSLEYFKSRKAKLLSDMQAVLVTIRDINKASKRSP